jgi:hypothetical protein
MEIIGEIYLWLTIEIMTLFGTSYIMDIVEIHLRPTFMHTIQELEMLLNKNGLQFNMFTQNPDLLLHWEENNILE